MFNSAPTVRCYGNILSVYVSSQELNVVENKKQYFYGASVYIT